MALEMLFSILLIVFGVYCLFYVNSTVGATVYTDPLGAAFWPRILLTLLIILLCINLIQIYRRTPKEERNLSSIKNISIKGILKNRVFQGMVLFVVYAILLDLIGFIPASFLMGICLSYLLGERRIGVLVLSSLLIVAIVFVLFFRGMGIQLPRGTVPAMRSMSLAIESFLRHLGK